MRVCRDETANIDAQRFGTFQHVVQLFDNCLERLNNCMINGQRWLFLYLISVEALSKLLNTLNDVSKILNKFMRIERGIHDTHIPVRQSRGCGHEERSPSRSNGDGKY